MNPRFSSNTLQHAVTLLRRAGVTVSGVLDKDGILFEIPDEHLPNTVLVSQTGIK